MFRKERKDFFLIKQDERVGENEDYSDHFCAFYCASMPVTVTKRNKWYIFGELRKRLIYLNVIFISKSR
jgi:hypothetical protein